MDGGLVFPITFTKEMNMKKNVEDLDNEVEELELHDKSEKEIEKIVKGMSNEARNIRGLRKHIRYQLYRLKSEAEGRAANVSEEGFKEKFECQHGFDGWKMFAVSWDVKLDDPEVVVARKLSETEVWDAIIESKFPTIKNGVVVYPDIKVQTKVETEIKKQNKNKKKAKKKTKGSK